MFPKLNYTQKSKLLVPLFCIGILLCWFLAFSKTYEAVKLNTKLNGDVMKESDLSFNPVYLQRKRDALDKILKSYQVGVNWNDQLWMKGSAIAAHQNVGVDYTMAKPLAEVDSNAVGLVQSLYFYGNYKQLVQLVDTLEHISGIGKISALQVKAPKPDLSGDRADQNMLRLDFKGLQK